MNLFGKYAVVVERDLLWWRLHVPELRKWGHCLTEKNARRAAAQAIVDGPAPPLFEWWTPKQAADELAGE